MDVQTKQLRFDQAVASLCPKLKDLLIKIPESAKHCAFEVRLRVGQPIVLTCPDRYWFVDQNARLINSPHMPYIITAADIAESVLCMCSHSIHAHQQELRNGFISLRGGHRAGICGTAVLSDNSIAAVRDITSINLRIAREIHGAADEIMQRIFTNRLCGVLIAGIPSSGKTTLLRDLTRQLACGKSGRYYKVAVVDERCELAAVYDGAAQNNLGICADILSGYPKAQGIVTALRSLSPQVIVCDEIGGGAEVDGILEGINAGVHIVATAHAASFSELMLRPQLAKLLASKAFEKIVLLGSADRPGEILQIVEVSDLLGENKWDGPYRSLLYDNGNFRGVRLVETGIDP